MKNTINSPAPMLELEGVTRSFASKQVLRGVDLVIHQGEIVGLIGPSGGGKSVLIKIIAGVDRGNGGTVRLGVGEHERALMFQEGALFDSLSVFDNVAFPLVGGRVPTASLGLRLRTRVRDQVEEILAQVGLTQAANRLPGEISGGMRRRVSLARALVARPKLLLLDDPTSGLDPIASRIIMELIVQITRTHNLTTLMVSQDLRRLLPCVERVVALFDGFIVLDDTLDGLASDTSEDLARVRSFIACRYDGLARSGVAGQ